MDKRGLIVCLAMMVAGCQPALKPDFGYPEDWPPPVSLAPGFAGLAGTYANDGVVTIAQGRTGPVTLASLLPEAKHRAQPGAAADTTVTKDSVVLEIVPGPSWQPYPTLRATVTTRDGTRVSEVDSGSDKNALLYQLPLDGRSAGRLGFGAGLVNVTLTLGADGSLLARIANDQSIALMVEPTDKSDYVWARFERISP